MLEDKFGDVVGEFDEVTKQTITGQRNARKPQATG